MATWERFVTAVAKGIALAWLDVQSRLPEVIREVATDEQKDRVDVFSASFPGVVREPSSGGARHEYAPHDDASGYGVRADKTTKR